MCKSITLWSQKSRLFFPCASCSLRAKHSVKNTEEEIEKEFGKDGGMLWCFTGASLALLSHGPHSSRLPNLSRFISFLLGLFSRCLSIEVKFYRFTKPRTLESMLMLAKEEPHAHFERQVAAFHRSTTSMAYTSSYNWPDLAV